LRTNNGADRQGKQQDYYGQYNTSEKYHRANPSNSSNYNCITLRMQLKQYRVQLKLGW
jgi:hypothetical protein